MNKEIKNKAASIRAKLTNLARAENVDFDALLLRYFQERFIYRLTVSKYSDRFVLKGGLFLLCLDVPWTRATMDIDFLAEHVKNDPAELEDIFKTIARISYDDGVTFDPSSITSERIKEDADYEGIRLKIDAELRQARKRLQLDIGFGDVITPKAKMMAFPTLLDEEPPEVKAYSIESVISEKFEAMIKLAMVNSRMKDFYDIYNLSLSHDFRGNNLKKAIKSTLDKRKTTIPDNPSIFLPEFYEDNERQKQWAAFLRKTRLDNVTKDFKVVMKRITTFLEPIVALINEKKEISSSWDHKKGRWNKNQKWEELLEQ